MIHFNIDGKGYRAVSITTVNITELLPFTWRSWMKWPFIQLVRLQYNTHLSKQQILSIKLSSFLAHTMLIKDFQNQWANCLSYYTNYQAYIFGVLLFHVPEISDVWLCWWDTPSLRSISTLCDSIWSHVAGWLWQIIPLTLSAGGDESHWRMGCIKWFYSIRASGITQAILFFCLYPLSLFCKLILRLQVPWILSGTIRENILLGKEHIPERYSLELLTDRLSIFWHFHPSLLCLPCPCSISIKNWKVFILRICSP